MNVKERIISLKLIGKKQEHTKFLEEIGCDGNHERKYL